VKARRGARAAAALALAILLSGCTLDITRVRGGSPIRESDFESLSVNRTTRAETLQLLGTPDKVEWKLGKDYWWYFYADYINVGLRFQLPPPPFDSYFGYRHNLLRLSEESDAVSAVDLVFDENEVLLQKSLRLSESYTPPDPEAVRSRFLVSPRIEHSVQVYGDGDVDKFSDIFENGYRVGLDLGWQMAPVATLLIGGSYQHHDGQTFGDGSGGSASADDLRMYQLEIGVRLGIPLRLIPDILDFDKVMRELFSDDLRQATGWRLYLQGTTGFTVNSSVDVELNGVPAGNLYGAGFGFSGGLGAGLEYSDRWGAVFAGVNYHTVDPFNDGGSPLEDDAGAFQTLLLGGGVVVHF
jgi:hypothetical protein